MPSYLVLLSKRIDPALFDERLFTVKVVPKANFPPDFLISSIAFVYVSEQSSNTSQIQDQILNVSKRFARSVVLATSPSPAFQKWLNALDKTPKLIVVPGGPSFLSVVLEGVLPLFLSLADTSQQIQAKTRAYAEQQAQEIFLQTKSFESITDCISMSTGVDIHRLRKIMNYLGGSLQRLGMTTREDLRRLGMTNEEAQSIALLFSEEEVEAPMYMEY